MIDSRFDWWSNLQHGGLLLDTQRLTKLISTDPADLNAYNEDRLRRRLIQFQDDPATHRGELVSFVLESICGFANPVGEWKRGGQIGTKWSRKAITGESVRPRHLWLGEHGATLPVFIDDQHRLGVGKGRRVVSHVLGWLRQGKEQLALITNGQEWRLVFAGLDYEAFCQWDISSWFAEGAASPELGGFRSLIATALWTPAKDGEAAPLLAAINDSRKGQADLSQILGERVRQAAELLVQAHTPALKEHLDDFTPQDIYRAAVRMIMRLVVVLFAESREGLLARDNPIFHGAYSLQGLREQLERISQYKLASGVGAYPRILALLQLIYQGSSHEALAIPAYGGELFAPGRPDDADGMKRALHLLETACFGEHQAVVMTDYHVRQILDLLTRTKVKIRQGRTTLLVPAPVDFSTLDSEYIGILYEGLLDFELRCAVENEPIVFLAVGNQPALPLATLIAMDDRAIKNLLEKLKDTSSGDDDDEKSDESEADEADDTEEVENTEGSDEEAEDESTEELDEGVADELAPEPDVDDPRFSLRQRAEDWARRACQVGNLVRRPRSRMTPERQMQFEQAIERKARQLVVKVVLPGEWYLVRWGGTRKGSGTFYTRPQLAIPTVHRTLRPLAYDPPLGADGQPDLTAPAETWTPKKPEAILRLKVCDVACGSGSFPLAALRFLTTALYESLIFHGRIRDHGGRAVLDLIYDEQTHEMLSSEALPCRPDDDEFEPRTRAILRRYIVERCIYGVDLDPLAVELCRLSLWIETLDRNLPLTFLNHKIKCGNSLIGVWFDQFLHYPAMAWEREGGDKNHSNGVHFSKEGWTKAIKAFKARVKPDLIAFIDGGTFPSMYPVDLTTVRTVHDVAERALAEIHQLGIAQVGERAARYEALRASPEFMRLQEAFDLWCALWFWPADQLDHAPLPSQFAAGVLDDRAREITREVATRQRFFHWELEFPDVFNSASHGFDAILGNPPWETLQPNSKEFFSAVDPLYRGYGKQEALHKQKEYFERDQTIERSWLEYTAYFKAIGEWVKHAGFPFGDRETVNSQEKTTHDFNIGDRGRSSFSTSGRRHARWKRKREDSTGYADADHCFRHQGGGKAYTYKLFLEQCYALLHDQGRLGLIVPSGVYSDYGAVEMRRLFVVHSRWEWLFGFENREGIFDIHRSFKFNPVIIAKGGETRAIRTAFMRHNLADWERGEELATDYTREQVVLFSPKSRAILEIQSEHDLRILTKIYANSVLLGDQSERGWGIKYAQGDFNMTSDSKLFPPRQKWEEWDYQPDEYSRWIKGPWKPISELWDELGIDTAQPIPIDPPCQRKTDDGIATGEVGCTSSRIRRAQPPYDSLPLPRADIPEGVILSKAATHFLREEDIPEVAFTDAGGRPLKIKVENDDGESEEVEVTGPAIALALCQGAMLQVYRYNSAYNVPTAGSQSQWIGVDTCEFALGPQFMIGAPFFQRIGTNATKSRFAFRDIARTTDTKTMIGSIVPDLPCGNTVPVLESFQRIEAIAPTLLSLTLDWVIRLRMGGTHLNYYVIAEAPLYDRIHSACDPLATFCQTLAMNGILFAPAWLRGRAGISRGWRSLWAVTESERRRLHCVNEALSACVFELEMRDICHALTDCDFPVSVTTGRGQHQFDPKGFWRIDKMKHPEHRHTILTLLAFHDLQEKISACGGDVAAGIEAFCNQNDGEGWMLPETLRLADYGLGHDERAREHQPVRECFGPRFYDWQLAQTPEESWRECHLHARNLLGAEVYQRLIDEIEGRAPSPATAPAAVATSKKNEGNGQGKLFDTKRLPLFDSERD